MADQSSVPQSPSRLAAESGPNVLAAEGENLTRKICNEELSSEADSHVTQHLNSVGHTRNSQPAACAEQVETLGQTGSPSLLSPELTPYSMALCRMLVSINVPLYKIQHPAFRDFMQKYHGIEVPDHLTLEKTCLKKVYEESIQRIRSSINDSRIWISIEEPTYFKGQYVVNTVVGWLRAGEPSIPFLLDSRIVEATDQNTIAQAFTDSLQLLWPEGIHHDRVLLFVSDGASYMKPAAEALKVLFPRMIHLTCVVHGINRVCEEIRSRAPGVDKLIANVKEVFCKAPSRVRKFRELAPNVPLPPEPVVPVCGPWLTAALYYATYLEDVQEVLEQLDSFEAAAIATAQSLMNDLAVKADLSFILTHFSKLPKLLEKPGCTTSPLMITLNILEDVRKDMEYVAFNSGPRMIRETFRSVIRNNSGLATISRMQESLVGDDLNSEISHLRVDDIASFSHAPLASVDVERTFPQYKLLLSDRRLCLTPENAKYHLIPMCNQPDPETE